MDCRLIEAELVGFHFGVLAGPARQAVETHLSGCGACLSSYLGVKRAIELEAQEAPAPSPELRTRLRAAVQREIATPSLFRRSGRRALPIYAAVAAGLLLAIAGLHRMRETARSPHERPPAMDTTREGAANLRFL